MGKYYDNIEFKSYSEKYQYMKKSNYCKSLIEAEQAGDILEIALKIALPILLMCLVMGIITLFVGLFH